MTLTEARTHNLSKEERLSKQKELAMNAISDSLADIEQHKWNKAHFNLLEGHAWFFIWSDYIIEFNQRQIEFWKGMLKKWN